MNEPYKYKICYNTDNVYNGHGTFYEKDTYDEILNDPQFDNIYMLKIKTSTDINILPPNLKQLEINCSCKLNIDKLPDSLTYIKICTFRSDIDNILKLPTKLQSINIHGRIKLDIPDGLPSNLSSLSITNNLSIKLSYIPIYIRYLSLSKTNIDINGLNIRSLIYLESFNCNSCQLKSLPKLPNNLLALNCNNNNIKQLPKLPYGLINLSINQNKINKLPEILPIRLKLLDVSQNKISELPRLPYKLKKLLCNYNNLTKLPKLPNTLWSISCTHNKITSLPKLPDSLLSIECDYNKLTSLPEFPNNIYSIVSISANNIKNIPKSFPTIGIVSIAFEATPIQNKINKYYNGNRYHYIKAQKAVNVIEQWYLEVRYDPKYKYCQRRVKETYIKMIA